MCDRYPDLKSQSAPVEYHKTLNGEELHHSKASGH